MMKIGLYGGQFHTSGRPGSRRIDALRPFGGFRRRGSLTLRPHGDLPTTDTPAPGGPPGGAYERSRPGHDWRSTWAPRPDGAAQTASCYRRTNPGPGCQWAHAAAATAARKAQPDEAALFSVSPLYPALPGPDARYPGAKPRR